MHLYLFRSFHSRMESNLSLIYKLEHTVINFYLFFVPYLTIGFQFFKFGFYEILIKRLLFLSRLIFIPNYIKFIMHQDWFVKFNSFENSQKFFVFYFFEFAYLLVSTKQLFNGIISPDFFLNSFGLHDFAIFVYFQTAVVAGIGK